MFKVAVSGGEIVSTFDSPEHVKLGSCDLIEEVMVGEDRLLRFSGVPIGLFVRAFCLSHKTFFAIVK